MSKNFGSFLTKSLFAAALAVTVSAAHADMAQTADDTLVQSAKDALRNGVFTGSIRVQAVDGVVYLYGHTNTYPARIDIENAVKAAEPGHKVISSIEDGSYN
jgi:hypothetical protein